MQKKLKCAVIGVGYLGNFHTQKYANLSNVNLTVICDIDETHGKEVASSYKTDFSANYHDLLGKVDAVSIVTSTPSHYSIAKFFLENKIHVFLEKPITTTLEEADQLIKIANNHNLVLQIGHIERFNPVFNIIKHKLKKPKLIECIRTAPYKTRCSDVSVVLDSMIHDIDIVHSLINSPIKQLAAYGGKILSKATDVAHVQIEFENGVIAILSTSRLGTSTERKINILENDCYFSGDLGEKTLKITKNDGNHEDLTLEKNDALYEEIASFVDAIENKKQPVVTGNDGKTALQTALLIEEKIQ